MSAFTDTRHINNIYYMGPCILSRYVTFIVYINSKMAEDIGFRSHARHC